MDTKEFIDAYWGKSIDFDGKFGAQCVDLFRQFNKEVYRLPHTGGVVGAKDLYENYDQLPTEKEYYHRIPVEDSIPKEGWFSIFRATKTNPYGHVALVLWASKKVMIVAEQNGLQQKGLEIKVRDYSNCLGYLVRK